MKKLFMVLLLCCIGCGEKKETNPETQEVPVEPPKPEKSVICFSSTGKDIQTENGSIRDSTRLSLELTGEVAIGAFHWIPAEKDSRKGVIEATKTGDELKGSYSFVQEGIRDTMFIEIRLSDSLALVKLLSDTGEESSFEVERISCTESKLNRAAAQQ